MLCWLTSLAVTISEDFSAPPYNFGAAGLAYMGVGPLIGACFGSIYSGPISDRAIVWMARGNYGYYEPEMRLRLMHIPSICTAVGLVGLAFLLTMSLFTINYPARFLIKKTIRPQLLLGPE